MANVMRLDLHGLTVHIAWKRFRETTQNSYFKQVKKITVITGHGAMSAEFQGWVSADPYSVKCERQNPNTGSWTVWIKKNKTMIKKKEPEPLDLRGLVKKFNS